MLQSGASTSVTLHELRAMFNLELIEDEQFFREWIDNLPELSEFEQQFLDRVKASYFNLIEYPPMLEVTVKMVVLSPLLQLAGFYLPPFHIKAEPSIQIEAYDGEVEIKGKIDVLVLEEQFWVLAIESKQADFSLESGLSQTLSYLLANPHKGNPAFGLLSNGRDFQFIKLAQKDRTQYAFSRSFDLRNPGNELYNVLMILKRLAQLLRAEIAQVA